MEAGGVYTPIESERRMLYVAMTRAKEELYASCVDADTFWMREAGLEPLHKTLAAATNRYQTLIFADMSLQDVWLSHEATRAQQELICSLQEGVPLPLMPSKRGDRWLIVTPGGIPPARS